MEPEQNPQPIRNIKITPPAPLPQAAAFKKPPLYRLFWPLALISLFVPLGFIAGVKIVRSGEIFEETKGTYSPVNSRAKILLYIIMALGVFLQGNLVLLST